MVPSPQTSRSSTKPFRLLDLPQEIQDDVYKKYFEGAELLVLPDWSRISGVEDDTLRFPSIQDLAIELVSHKVGKKRHKGTRQHLAANSDHRL